MIPRPAARRAWLIGGALLTVVAVGWTTGTLVHLLAHDGERIDLEFASTGIAVLDVDNYTGTIEILGDEDATEITVSAEIDHGLRRTGHRERIVGDRLELTSSCPIPLNMWCEVDYRIVVPADLAVVADTGSGRIIVRDVRGTVAADGDNGSIELSRLTGDVSVSTDNGSVLATGLRSSRFVADSDNGRVDLHFATAPDEVRATSDKGRVEVVVPDTPETYVVALDTDNGSTDAAVRTDPTSDRTIEASTDNGDVIVRYATG